MDAYFFCVCVFSMISGTPPVTNSNVASLELKTCIQCTL